VSVLQGLLQVAELQEGVAAIAARCRAAKDIAVMSASGSSSCSSSIYSMG
jgi:hypothetical protein